MTRKGSFDSERFWNFVRKSSYCWEWTGYKTPNGYGMFGKRYAHRLAYELLVGPIGDGLTLDHLCRFRDCVNPAHLEPLSMRDNILRGTAPTAENAAKTHCVRGHAFDKANSIVRKDRPGTRECRQCRRDQQRIAMREKYRKEHPNAKRRKA